MGELNFSTEKGDLGNCGLHSDCLGNIFLDTVRKDICTYLIDSGAGFLCATRLTTPLDGRARKAPPRVMCCRVWESQSTRGPAGVSVVSTRGQSWQGPLFALHPCSQGRAHPLQLDQEPDFRPHSTTQRTPSSKTKHGKGVKYVVTEEGLTLVVGTPCNTQTMNDSTAHLKPVSFSDQCHPCKFNKTKQKNLVPGPD